MYRANASKVEHHKSETSWANPQIFMFNRPWNSFKRCKFHFKNRARVTLPRGVYIPKLSKIFSFGVPRPTPSSMGWNWPFRCRGKNLKLLPWVTAIPAWWAETSTRWRRNYQFITIIRMYVAILHSASFNINWLSVRSTDRFLWATSM